MTKTTAFTLLRSNGHTAIQVDWTPEETILRISTLDANVEVELTPFETQRLQAAMLPDENFSDPSRVRRSRFDPQDKEEEEEVPEVDLTAEDLAAIAEFNDD